MLRTLSGLGRTSPPSADPRPTQLFTSKTSHWHQASGPMKASKELVALVTKAADVNELRSAGPGSAVRPSLEKPHSPSALPSGSRHTRAPVGWMEHIPRPQGTGLETPCSCSSSFLPCPISKCGEQSWACPRPAVPASMEGYHCLGHTNSPAPAHHHPCSSGLCVCREPSYSFPQLWERVGGYWVQR